MLQILEHGREAGCDKEEERFIKVDEIPFDFTRRRMSVVLENKVGKKQLVTKGAIEEMLSISSYVEMNNKVVKVN